MTETEQAKHLATINRCVGILREIEALGDRQDESSLGRAILAAQEAKEAADAISAYLRCCELIEKAKVKA